MYCGKCGNKLEDGARFCGNCGNAIENGLKSYHHRNNSVNKIIFLFFIGVFLISAIIILVTQIKNSPTNKIIEDNRKDTVKEEQEEPIVSYEKLNNFEISEVYLDMNDYVHANDIFWVKGKDILDNNSYFVGIDLDFNVHYKIKCTDNANVIENPIGTNYLLCYAFSGGAYKLIDMEGNSADFIPEKEKLYWASNDSEGGTVWTIESVDSYSSHDTIIRAYDLNGNLRAQWSSNKLNEKYNMMWDGSLKEGKYKGLSNNTTTIKYCGDEIYYMNAGDYILILNVATGMDFGRKDDMENIVVELVGEDIYLCHSYGGFNSASNKDSKVSIYDKQGNLNFYGNVGTPYNTYVSTLCYDNYIGYGIFTSVDNSDSWSRPTIYMNYKSEIIYEAKDVDNRSNFCDGHAAISMCNDGNVYFTTLIDINGEWLFEPVKGRYYDSYYYANSFDSFEAYQRGIEMYRISLDDQMYLLDTAGRTIPLTSDVNFYADMNGTLNAVYLKDGWLYFNSLH